MVADVIFGRESQWIADNFRGSGQFRRASQSTGHFGGEFGECLGARG